MIRLDKISPQCYVSNFIFLPKFCTATVPTTLKLDLLTERAAYRTEYLKFLNKCRYNDIPTSAIERSQLLAIIEATRSQLRNRSYNIATIELYRTLNCQKSLLSPIRTLPSEILSQVFTLAITEPISFKTALLEVEFEEEEGWQCRKLYGSVFRLTRVCFRWRQHALSLPELWSSISFGLIEPSDPADVIAFLMDCIQRSEGRAPMDLSIDLPDSIRSPSWHNSAHIRFLNALADRASRWRSLECYLDRIDGLVDLHQILRSKTPEDTSPTLLPHLESLILVFDYLIEDDPSSDSMAFRTFYSLPCLHTLDIICLRATDLIDLSNLEVLKTRHYIGKSFACLLGRCPKLKFLTVQSFRAGPSPAPSSLPCVHTNLSTLKITGIDEYFALGVWEHVRLPNLTEVVLGLDVTRANRRFYPGSSQDPISDLKNMLLRSGCVLDKVTFAKVNLITAVPEWFFSNLPRNPKGSEFLIKDIRLDCYWIQ